MKVYFHEDQLKDNDAPLPAIVEQNSPISGSKTRRIVISPLVSVLSMVGIGIGAYAFEKRTHIRRDHSSTSQTGQEVKIKSSSMPMTAGPQVLIPSQTMIITPVPPSPATYQDLSVISTEEDPQPKIKETVAQGSLSAKSTIDLPSDPVISNATPDKTIIAAPLPSDIANKINENPAPALVEVDMKGTKMDKARMFFNRQRYYDACALSRLEMNNGNKTQRHEAVIMTAQCYLQLGYKPTAQHLLEFVISEGGPGKREARRILEESKR